MPSAAVSVAYGYLLIGTQPRILAEESPGGGDEFISAPAGLVRLQVGTHTGEVQLTWTVVGTPTLTPRSGRAARGSVQLAGTDEVIYVSTFHGMAPEFEVRVPADWSAVRVTAVSERYFEASMGEDGEVVELEFSRA